MLHRENKAPKSHAFVFPRLRASALRHSPASTLPRFRTSTLSRIRSSFRAIRGAMRTSVSFHQSHAEPGAAPFRYPPPPRCAAPTRRFHSIPPSPHPRPPPTPSPAPAHLVHAEIRITEYGRPYTRAWCGRGMAHALQRGARLAPVPISHRPSSPSLPAGDPHPPHIGVGGYHGGSNPP
jgi:hypothetical protein